MTAGDAWAKARELARSFAGEAPIGSVACSKKDGDGPPPVQQLFLQTAISPHFDRRERSSLPAWDESHTSGASGSTSPTGALILERGALFLWLRA